MIVTAAKHWPQYAFWLASGAAEPEAWHVALARADGVEEKKVELAETTAYFGYQLSLIGALQPPAFPALKGA
ncbi:hypothetical protein [Massilia endophytica]|uniref:hypothetical protein n=1 Tax=Massilia endophytica TaxID=2899220 RepID=UPI001E4E77BA|nr:hypothetical protein [Massilia endophytica]UGQ46241.1 hypothetical protein LSQ66_21120 [Massilia endophytica]